MQLWGWGNFLTGLQPKIPCKQQEAASDQSNITRKGLLFLRAPNLLEHVTKRATNNKYREYISLNMEIMNGNRSLNNGSMMVINDYILVYEIFIDLLIHPFIHSLIH